MNQANNEPNEQPNKVWQEDRANKKMRLWELGGKGNILDGWVIIIKAMVALLLIIGLLIYGIYTKQLNQFLPGVSPSIILLLIAFVILSTLYRIGLGIWEIYLGKSKLLRKQWTWWYAIITMPLVYIAFLVRFFYQADNQITPLFQIIIIASGTLAFGALYYYTWTIKRKFESTAVEPIREDLQELSRWPVAKDRPILIFLLSPILIFLSFPLLFINGIIGGFSIFNSSASTGIDLAIMIAGFLTGIAFLVSGIGLIRMKKYGFIGMLCATLLLAAMALLSKDAGGINIYLYASIVFVLVDIYLYFNKEKFN